MLLRQSLLVCKIVDYGKYKYEQVRKEKEAKKKQKVIDIKEIRLSPISILTI